MGKMAFEEFVLENGCTRFSINFESSNLQDLVVISNTDIDQLAYGLFVDIPESDRKEFIDNYTRAFFQLFRNEYLFLGRRTRHFNSWISSGLDYRPGDLEFPNPERKAVNATKSSTKYAGPIDGNIVEFTHSIKELLRYHDRGKIKASYLGFNYHIKCPASSAPSIIDTIKDTLFPVIAMYGTPNR